MTLTSIGDLAQGFGLRTRNADLKKAMTRLGTEVSSGRVADPAPRVGGHFSFLSGIEHDLVMAASFAAGAREVAVSSTAMQGALERIGSLSDGLIETLAIASTASGPTDLSVVAADARGTLDGVVSSLNTGVAGRRLFSGVAVDTAPLASAQAILAGLRSAIASENSLSGVLAAADAFFDAPGGGFETLVYQGSTASLAPVQLGAGESADLDLRADHPALRDTLKHMALAALADDPALSLSDGARRALFGDVLDGLLSAKDAQVAVRADLGYAEERIERAQTRLEAEISSLELARSDLLSVDPYEAATELEATQIQLETLYTVTARMSRLSLVNFLS